MAVVLLLAYILYAIWQRVQPITIYDYQKGLLYKNGRYIRTLSAGRYWKFTSGTNIVVEDMRGRSMIVPGQEMLTSDNLTIKASAVVPYRITDARIAHEQSDHACKAGLSGNHKLTPGSFSHPLFLSRICRLRRAPLIGC